ncbi:MAG: type IV secretory system conjugative DNA transfer family protein [Bacteroidota bacterium]
MNAKERNSEIYLLFGLCALFLSLAALEYYILWSGGGGEGLIWRKIIPYVYQYRLIIRFGGIILYMLSFFLFYQEREDQRERQLDEESSKMAIFISGGLTGLGILLIYNLDYLPYLDLLYPISFFLCLTSIPIWTNSLSAPSSKRIQNPRKRIKSKLGFNLKLKDGWINISNPFRGILVIGSAGSGKSYSVAEPMIEEAIQKNYSGIVYDFKFPSLSEVVYNGYLRETEKRKKRKTIGRREIENEQEIKPELKLVSFTDLKRSSRINPLKPENLPIMAYAEEFSLSLISNLMPESIKQKDFWVRSAHAILTAVIWYMKKHHPKMSSLPHVVAMICNKNYESLVKLLEEDPETAGLIASLSVALKAESAKQISGMMGTLQIALSSLNNPQIAWVLSGDDFSLNLNDPQNPVFLCIGTSPNLADTLAPAVSLIITVALKLMNEQHKHHSLVLLDEAPTLYIPKFDQIPATARSNKIATIYMAQDISQMIQSYGQVNAEVIIGNLNNQLFGRVANQKTADYISRIFGKGEKEVIEFSRSQSGEGTFSVRRSKSYSHRIRERELITAPELMSLGVGEFVGLTAGKRNESFWGKIQRRGNQDQDIPAEGEVSERELIRNFEKIHQEVRVLLEKPDFVG